MVGETVVDIAIVVLAALAGACWRRCFGGWTPRGIGLPRIVDLIVFGLGAAAIGLMAFWPWPLSPHSGLLAFAAIGLAYSWTPAHGTDSNRFAGIKNDWIEQALRYGLFPGALVALPFLFKAAWISAAIMLASGVLAGLAAAIFLTFGPRWTWLPIDPAPNSFADGRMVYNEFALGAVIGGGYTAACLLAGGGS
jgi:hypothetical protein